MNYTENTKLSEIKNAQTIADSTKKAIDILLTKELGFFVKFDDETQEYSIKTESLSTICGTSSGAIANQIKKRKGTIFEKLGDFFATWSKDAGKLSATEIAQKAEKDAKITMAKNMLIAKLSVEQIAKITGLSVEEINALNA
jgi:predicted transposase/invertase (TIGR01784 family)